jgi:aminoglycoside 3-N-acetyltransferase I
MTRNESTGLFIYDLAVHPDHQRRGAGRALIPALRAKAADCAISVAFVPADNEDTHALDFLPCARRG